MTRPEFALRYDKCTAAELRAFIKEREGQDPPLGKKKQVCIAQLRRLDNEATFRFQDLAPELRNLIYSDLLYLDPEPSLSTRRCWTAILRTSKQVNQEACSILYGDAVIRVALNFHYGVNLGSAASWTCCVDTKSEDYNLGRPSLTTAKIDWPDFLLKSRHLCVAINFLGGSIEAETYKIMMQRINVTLYGLTTHLTQGTHLKSFRLHLDVARAMELAKERNIEADDMLQQALWPLARLGSVPSRTITGLVGESVEKLLAQMQSQAQPIYQPLRHSNKPLKLYVALLRKANALCDLLNYIDRKPRDATDLIAQMTQLRSLLSEQQFVDDLQEQLLLRCARKLEDTFAAYPRSDVDLRACRRIDKISQLQKDMNG